MLYKKFLRYDKQNNDTICFQNTVRKAALIHVGYIKTMFIESNQGTKHPEAGP